MALFLVENIVFYPFTDNEGTKTKYVKGSISGLIFFNDIYTKQEIIDEFPDAKSYPHLHALCKAWGNKD